MFIEIIKITIPSLLIIILAIILYRFTNTKKIRFISKLFTIEAEKFREIIKNDFNIIKLKIVDSQGKAIKELHDLKESGLRGRSPNEASLAIR